MPMSGGDGYDTPRTKARKRFGPDGMPLEGGGTPLHEDPFKPHKYGPDGLPLSQKHVHDFGEGLGEFGPDGQRLHGSSAKHRYGPDGMETQDRPYRAGVELEFEEEKGWYGAESGSQEQEELAARNFAAICQVVDELWERGECPSGRWTNDPAVVPTDRFPDVKTFPPNDSQLFLPKRGHEDDTLWDQLQMVATPAKDDEKSVPWCRLVSYGTTAGSAGSSGCTLFDDTDTSAIHCGRVYQGDLDNGYLVEALNAVSLRPKLAKRLFHCVDVERSVYALRLFKNGTWVCPFIDDYVPAGRSTELGDAVVPFCCRSEHFPAVLWPSLVEKAYAKICAVREPDGPDSGGWQALGGGGRVEEALADLTGGVGGSFSTRDVAPDRLFIYFNELQRDCLFVCRPHIGNCIKRGLPLSPYASFAINRAAVHECACYVQVFCSADPRRGTGALPDLGVPDELLRQFPEKAAAGFFWLNIYDFHYYFEMIYECRLTNSPDVGIVGMPPPRLPLAMVPSPAEHGREVPAWRDKQHVFAEWIFATEGTVSEHCPPEFRVAMPQFPCEVVATVEQTDPRVEQTGSRRKDHAAILLKVYEEIDREIYSVDLVCKSSWMPVRSSMVAFKSSKGGVFKIIAEFPKGSARCHKLIFRCYASWPSVQVDAAVSLRTHMLSKPDGPPLATKWTFVGCVDPTKMTRTDEPEPADDDIDHIRRQLALAAPCCVM